MTAQTLAEVIRKAQLEHIRLKRAIQARDLPPAALPAHFQNEERFIAAAVAAWLVSDAVVERAARRLRDHYEREFECAHWDGLSDIDRASFMEDARDMLAATIKEG